MHIFNLLLL